jgi:uncharacterized phage protein gp47/JayE
MALPTFSQIVSSMLSFLQASRPDINTNTGTVVNDVVVSTVANQLSAENGTSPSVYSSIAYTQELQAFATDAANLVPSDLDQIGANYGLTRLPATAATGIITFRIRNYTTSSPIITVTSGTVVSTLATSQSPAVSFATTATVTFTPSLAPSYYNPASGFYEQSTTIVCQTAGTVGNVGAATITSLVGPGIGIDAVTNNTATTGGTNTESNTAFAARIQIKLEGNNVGTPNGIISLVNTNPNVIQAIVVGPNDPEMQRDQFGGSVDVYIRGQVLLTVSDTPTYTSAGSQQFILVNQPALSIGSVTGVVNGSPFTFSVVSTPNSIPPGTDAVFVENPNSLFAGSTEAGSYLQWHSFPIMIISVPDGSHLQVNSTTGIQIGDTIRQGSNTPTVLSIPDSMHLQVTSSTGFVPGAATVNNLPDNNTVVTITYTYDSLMATLQALFNNNSNHIVASDILVREAIEAFINFTAGILIVPGYVSSSVVANVQTALTNYINGLGLGAVLVLSELVTIIQDVPGVSEVDLSSLVLQSVEGAVTTTIPPGQQISVGKNAYPVANSLTITVES